MTKDNIAPIRVFISYARKDLPFQKRLVEALSPLVSDKLLSIWSDIDIEAGQSWDSCINQNLEVADLILLLVSSSFMGSKYIYTKEMKKALELHEDGLSTVVPIILRPVVWSDAPFAFLQVLPSKGKPISTWANREKAWENVVEGIKKIVNRNRGIALSPGYQSYTSITREMAKKLYDRSGINLPDEVVEFLGTFEFYLETLGDMSEQTKFIPKDLWKVIDDTGYGLTWKFIDVNGLKDKKIIKSLSGNVKGHQLAELLAFLLKNSWIQGYYMHKFRIYDYIPIPRVISANQILKEIDKMGSLINNLETQTPVFLQRCVSAKITLVSVQESLAIGGDDLVNTVQPFINEWYKTVLLITTHGVLVSAIEERIYEKIKMPPDKRI